MAFLSLDCLEALYGGAAGGGKSDALLMAALQYVHIPGYAALILRRTFKDLMRSDAIMARAEEWLRGTRAEWKAETKTWHFPSGATLSFGYFDTVRDRDAYQGGAWQFIAFDETTQFPEAWYLYLFSRLRKTSQDAPLRMRGATNPGGIGHDWIFKRFIERPEDDRPFIPATLDDNPSMDASYRDSLSKLDEVTRRQLLEGVWVRDSQGLVYRTVQRIAVLPLTDDPGDWTYLLGVDFGIRDSCAYVVLGWRKGDRVTYVIESFKENNKTVTDSAERVKVYMARFSLSRIIGDLGGMGAAFGIEFQRRHGIPIEAADKVNKRGYIGLLNGAVERGELVVVESDNGDLLKEMGELPWSDETRQKESAGFANHLCFVAGTMVATHTGASPIESLRVGDWVVTRGGSRQVLAAAATGMREIWDIETTDGRTLSGTADHPVFTEENSWCRIDSLPYGASLRVCPVSSSQPPKSSLSLVFGTGDIPSQRSASCGSTSLLKVVDDCTAQSGSTRTAPSLPVTSFITRTRIRSTTLLKIWSGSLRRSTCAITWLRRNASRLLDETSRRLSPLLLNGTAPMLVGHGMLSTAAKCGPFSQTFTTRAPFAPVRSRLERSERTCAPPSASPSSAETAASTTSIARVSNAPWSSGPTDTASRRAAPCRVRRVSRTERVEPVYALTVDGEHEYFANGILVSNCDALLYSWRAGYSFMAETPVPKVTDPVQIIQAETAAIWRQHEEEMRRGRRGSFDDFGSKLFDGEDS